jgi:hypothetical protein
MNRCGKPADISKLLNLIQLLNIRKGLKFLSRAHERDKKMFKWKLLSGKKGTVHHPCPRRQPFAVVPH